MATTITPQDRVLAARYVAIQRRKGGFHPDDNAHDIVNARGPIFTSEEADVVNNLADAAFRVHGDRLYDLVAEITA